MSTLIERLPLLAFLPLTLGLFQHLLLNRVRGYATSLGYHTELAKLPAYWRKL